MRRSILISLCALLLWTAPSWAVTCATSGGNPALSYIPVTLTNAQAGATAANLQAMVTINSNTNSGLYDTTLRNANWQDGAGNVLKSWLESGETNTSTASVYWVNLGANTIAGSSGTLTIYQCIYGTGVVAFDGTATGAEPKFDGTYGHYDDGAAVFPFYDNFNGNSLNAQWNSVPGTGGSVSVNNGLTLTTGTTSAAYSTIITASTVTKPVVFDGYATSQPNTSDHRLGLYESTSTTLNSQGRPESSYGAVAVVASNLELQSVDGSGNVLNVTADSAVTTGGVYSIAWSATGAEFAAFNYSSATGADSVNTIGNYYLGINHFLSGGSTGRSITVQWARTRLYPPSGVLPTVSQGADTGLVGKVSGCSGDVENE